MFIEYLGFAKDGNKSKVVAIVQLKAFDIETFEPAAYLVVYGRLNGKLRAKISYELMGYALIQKRSKEGYVRQPKEILETKEYSKLRDNIYKHITWATIKNG